MPKVDKEKCIGCSTCVALCPNTFKMDDDGKAVAFTQDGDSPESIQLAIDSCPTQAISA